MAQGYIDTPGVHSEEQIQAWQQVTDAVHAAGGRIFVQLWHVGRISHPSVLNGETPVAPSAIKPAGELFTATGPQPFVTPRALETDEIPQIAANFRQAALNVRRAGFDGVEVHGANRYLLDQFLESGTNTRADRYGGSLENRARVLLDVVEAVTGRLVRIGSGCARRRAARSTTSVIATCRKRSPMWRANLIALAWPTCT